MDLGQTDVVLVTLSSCRYDTAVRAATPNLSRVGQLLEAETSGTYTLPAHISFFIGVLPTPVRSAYLIEGRNYQQIWRNGPSRKAAAAISLDGETLFDHYRRSGFRIIAASGNHLFDPTLPFNLLPTLFEASELQHFGNDHRDDHVMAAMIRDRAAALPLTHVDDLAARCLESDKFFLFVNCSCTHFPYTTPGSQLTVGAKNAMRRMLVAQPRDRGQPENVRVEGIDLLRDLQRDALEWADAQLGLLFASLRHRRPLVVVCGDHGEAFGEDGRYGHAQPHPAVTTVPLWCGLLADEQESPASPAPSA